MKRKTSMSDSIGTFAYTYDSLGRRTQRIDDSSITNLFGYNLRSELVSAEMGTNTYSYAYDPIGNRTETVENGLTTTYAANSLNQYTALNPASTNPTPFTYDPDGNMTSDGTWSYSWDAENRLIEVQPLVTNLDSTLLQFMYDAQSRRIARREFAWNDYLGETTWHYVQGRAFRYDGWNLLHELKPPATPRTPPTYIPQTNLYLTGVTGPVAAEYVWGLDLSATLHGAGGVGGLLQSTCNDTNAFSFCDANGNVSHLVKEDGIGGGNYEYDSYANIIVNIGDDAFLNSFRFGTRFHDEGSGLYYFGYRYYDSNLGRWLSRDPIGEMGGLNLYGFVRNQPITSADSLGLEEVTIKDWLLGDYAIVRYDIVKLDCDLGGDIYIENLSFVKDPDQMSIDITDIIQIIGISTPVPGLSIGIGDVSYSVSSVTEKTYTEPCLLGKRKIIKDVDIIVTERVKWFLWVSSVYLMKLQAHLRP